MTPCTQHLKCLQKLWSEYSQPKFLSHKMKDPLQDHGT